MISLEGAHCRIALPVGTFSLQPLDPDRHTDLLHRWMNDAEVARFWGMAWARDRIARYLCQQVASAHSVPYLGALDSEPMRYWELYRAEQDRLAEHYPARRGDAGVHLLLGPAGYRGRGLGVALLRAVSDWQLRTTPSASSPSPTCATPAPCGRSSAPASAMPARSTCPTSAPPS